MHPIDGQLQHGSYETLVLSLDKEESQRGWLYYIEQYGLDKM